MLECCPNYLQVMECDCAFFGVQGPACSIKCHPCRVIGEDSGLGRRLSQILADSIKKKVIWSYKGYEPEPITVKMRKS